MSLNLAARMSLETRGFTGPLQGSRSALAGFTQGLRGMAGPLAAMAAGWLSLQTAVSQVRQTFGLIASFDAAMSKVGAVSGATAEEMEQMTRVARELGATTSFSAKDAAEGLTYLAMAGFRARESIAALPQVLSLAKAGGLELGSAADIASNIMSAFGISAEDLLTVVDDLATVSASANTNVEQLGQGISYAGPIANAFGVSLQEVLAALGVLGDVGMGDRAGNQISAAFRQLTTDTARTKQALKEMGLTMEDVDPAANSLRDILVKLANEGMTPAQANAIFGEAAAGVLALTGNIGKMDQLTRSMAENEGAAAKMAATMGDNLAGDVAELESAMEELQLTLGDLGARDFFRGIVQSFGQLVSQVTAGLKVIEAAMAENRIGELLEASLKLGMADAANFLMRSLQSAVSGFMASGRLIGDLWLNQIKAIGDPNLWLGIAKVAGGALQGLGGALRAIFAKPLNYLQAVVDTVVQKIMSTLSKIGLGDPVEVKTVEQNLAEREAEGGSWLAGSAKESLAMSGEMMRAGVIDIQNALSPLMDQLVQNTAVILESIVAEWNSAPDMIDTGSLRKKFQDTLTSFADTMAQLDAAREARKAQAVGESRGDSGGAGVGSRPIVTDRLARIGGFIGGGGGPALDYARRTATATSQMAKGISNIQTLLRNPDGSTGGLYL